jgi:hypothetical protein
VDRLGKVLAAPGMIIGQVTESPVGLVVLMAVLGPLIVWIAARKPGWSAIWPALLVPAPWIVLIFWAAWHWRVDGPQTAFHAELRGLLMLGVTLALSVWAVIRANRVRLPVAGLCLVNGLFALIAVLFAGMMTTGTWL